MQKTSVTVGLFLFIDYDKDWLDGGGRLATFTGKPCMQASHFVVRAVTERSLREKGFGVKCQEGHEKNVQNQFFPLQKA